MLNQRVKAREGSTPSRSANVVCLTVKDEGSDGRRNRDGNKPVIASQGVASDSCSQQIYKLAVPELTGQHFWSAAADGGQLS